MTRDAGGSVSTIGVGVCVCVWFWLSISVESRRLTCKLVKVLVELVPVPVLGDVTHEEPVVVVRDGHAHLPAFADLTTIELSPTETTGTQTNNIATKNQLIRSTTYFFVYVLFHSN